MPKETEAKGKRRRAVQDGLSPSKGYSNKVSFEKNKSKCLSPQQGDSSINNPPNKAKMPYLDSIPETKTLSQENVTLNKNQKDLREIKCERKENLEINISQLKAKAVKVPIKVSEISSLAIVDTGSSVSVLNKVIYEQIPEKISPHLSQENLKLNVAEAGQDITVSGITKVDVELGGLKFTWPVYVAPIRDDFLLGWDMISHYKFVIDPERGLCVQQNWLKNEEESSSKETASTGVVHLVTLSASAEFVSSCQGHGCVKGDVVFQKCWN